MRFETEAGYGISEMATAFGDSEKIGQYAVAAAVNEILTRADRVAQMEIRICAPMEEKKTHLYDIKSEVVHFCKKCGLTFSEPEIIRTVVAAKTFVQVNAVAADVKEQAWNKETMRAGQDIVLTKWIGLEGTLRILDERKAELRERFAGTFLRQVEELQEVIFAEREIRVAKAGGVSVMRQVGEGGIFAALYRLAKEAGNGLVVDLKMIPVRQETIEICEYYKLNPYQLASAGNILMICDDGEALADALPKEEIEAAVIGRLTDNNDKIIQNGEDIRYIDRPAPDELMKI